MLGAERERVQGCAWSANGTAGGAVCRVSADIACIAMCVWGGGGGNHGSMNGMAGGVLLLG